MKWLVHSEPVEGSLQRTRKFAFLPTLAFEHPPPIISASGLTWTVWLEFYELVEKADHYGHWVVWYRRVLFPQPGE